MQTSPINPTFDQVYIVQAEEIDLVSLEWDGEYSHFRHMFTDTYQLTLLGQAKIWVAKTLNNYLIGQLFVSLNGVRPELADGRIRAYVFGFRVRPVYRNQGIGTMMMRTVEEDLRENYFRMITLNVTQINHAARKFYERLGYRVVGDDPGHWSYLDQFGNKQQVHEPAWRMEKELL